MCEELTIKKYLNRERAQYQQDLVGWALPTLFLYLTRLGYPLLIKDTNDESGVLPLT